MAPGWHSWLKIRLNLRKGEQFSPQYLRLNPKAVVPTLVHDGAALPYMVSARALRLSPLWDALDNVAPWLDRGEKEVSRLPLTDIFGSPSFHAMVAGYADADEPAMRQLVETR